MTESPQATEILGTLRAHGGRITTSRRAILDALLRSDGHLTAERLTASVQELHPDIHESTVYRFLDDLERLGVVDHVHLGHGPAVYHLTDDGHHHLVCQECDAVVELPAEVLSQLRRKLAASYAFEVDFRHFAIPGRCRRCTSR